MTSNSSIDGDKPQAMLRESYNNVDIVIIGAGISGKNKYWVWFDLNIPFDGNFFFQECVLQSTTCKRTRTPN
jgi:hypothetical protein